jgi:hypothetical protein
MPSRTERQAETSRDLIDAAERRFTDQGVVTPDAHCGPHLKSDFVGRESRSGR